MSPPRLSIHPPLLNSACPWATTPDHLRSLLESPATGAVTVRTSLVGGFDHQPPRHRFVFFDPASTRPGGDGRTTHSLPDDGDEGQQQQQQQPAPDDGPDAASASLNNLGYSPVPLAEYLDILRDLAAGLPDHVRAKTVILSVTGSTGQEVRRCYDAVAEAAPSIAFPLAVEVNLSCPNIPGAPPAAYDPAALAGFASALPRDGAPLPVGIKTPPYTHEGQYAALLDALRTSSAGERLAFITSTNTLGSCLVLDPASHPALPAGGLGGMAGPPIHPLSLGNVSTIRKLLDMDPALSHLAIIGVGGVSDGQTYRNMRSVGAAAVALATALGKQGTAVFSKIESDIGGKW